jgi:DNA gyrase subunit A
VQKLVTRLEAILSSEQLLLGVIKDELREVQRDFSDPRRTEIVGEASDLSDEDLIADEDMVVTVSHTGYVKRNPVSLYRAQKRGGKGKTGAMTSDDDFIEQIFVASTHAYLLLFTTKGRVFWLKVHELPQAGRAARGKAIVNLVPLGADEKLAALLPVKELPKKISGDGEEAEGEEAPAAEAEAPAAGEAGQAAEARDEARAAAEDAIAISKGPYIVFVTRNGLIKRTALSAFSRPRPSGLKALSIEENDSLVSVMHARGNEDILIGTADGMAIRFEQKEVRSMGRTAYGVKGITLEEGDHVVGAELVHSGSTLLTVTENGYGKRTTIDEYRRTHRGGKGIIDIKTSERNGKVVAMLQVTDADELMIITNKGMIIRTRVAEVSLIGRNTQGVRLIDLRQEGEKVVGATRAPEEREADAAAEVAAEQAASGHEDDDGSPPDGSEET